MAEQAGPVRLRHQRRAVFIPHLQQQTQCDVTLRCRDGSVPCHQVVLASLSPLLRSVLSSASWDETITIMLPDLTVQELSTFLANIYEGSTANASINMDLLVLLGLIVPCKPQQDLENPTSRPQQDPCKPNQTEPNKTLSPDPIKSPITNSSPKSKKTERKNYNKAIQKLLTSGQNNEQDDYNSVEIADPLDMADIKEDVEDSDGTEHDPKESALELLENKIKQENQDVVANNSTTISEEKTLEKERKKQMRIDKILNHDQFGHNKRIAEDPIWDHIKNIDCSENNYSKGSVTCNYCEKTIPFSGVDRHIWTIHNILVERPSRYKKPFVENIKKAAFWEHFSVDPENKFRCICQLCGKNLSKMSATKHLRQRHSVGDPILCSICGKSFRDNNTKNIHELTHTKSYQYFCSVCGKGFYENWHLSDHMKRTHDDSEENAFQCSDCGKSFKVKRDLSTHYSHFHMRKKKYGNAEKVYTEEEIAKKPHLCSICKKRFAKEDYFKLHMKIHSGEAKVECEVCKKTFADAYYLKAHMKTVHSDERPFNCSVCHKSFKLKKVLQYHMVVHTGDTPYHCQQCDKRFAWNSVLRTHSCQA